MFTRLLNLCRVSIEPYDLRQIIRHLTKIGQLATRCTVQVDNSLSWLRIHDMACHHGGQRLRMEQSLLIARLVHQARDPVPVLGHLHREPGPILEDRLFSLSSYTISSMPTILGHYRCFSASLQPLTSSDPGSIQMRTVQHRLRRKPIRLQTPSPRRCLGRYDWKRGSIADHIMNLYLLKTFRRKLANYRIRITPQSVESKVESGTHTSQSFDNIV